MRSLPTPLSPVMSTLASPVAMRPTRARISCICGLAYTSVLGTVAAVSAPSTGADGNDTLLTKASRSAPRAASEGRRQTLKVWSGAVTRDLSKAGTRMRAVDLEPGKAGNHTGNASNFEPSDVEGNSDTDCPDVSPGPDSLTEL